MANVILKGYIVVPEPDLPAVLEELKNHTLLTREEAGCLIFEVTQRENSPTHFDVYEEFTHQQAFEAHQARVKSSRWGYVSRNVERHYEIFQ